MSLLLTAAAANATAAALSSKPYATGGKATTTRGEDIFGVVMVVAMLVAMVGLSTFSGALWAIAVWSVILTVAKWAAIAVGVMIGALLLLFGVVAIVDMSRSK